MSVAHGGQPNVDDTLAALTADEIADLKANWPLHPDDTVGTDRYDAWERSAYFMRHLYDNIGVDPFGL